MSHDVYLTEEQRQSFESEGFLVVCEALPSEMGGCLRAPVKRLVQEGRLESLPGQYTRHSELHR